MSGRIKSSTAYEFSRGRVWVDCSLNWSGESHLMIANKIKLLGMEWKHVIEGIRSCWGICLYVCSCGSGMEKLLRWYDGWPNHCHARGLKRRKKQRLDWDRRILGLSLCMDKHWSAAFNTPKKTLWHPVSLNFNIRRLFVLIFIY